MTYNSSPETTQELSDELKTMHKEVLVEMLTDIAASLAYDEEGVLNPEESVAADSAADFVESVTHTFFKMRIALG